MNLSIKDVPDALAEALKRRAAQHHRSLQGELMSIIEQAVLAEPAAAPAPLAAARGAARVIGHDKRGEPIVRTGWKSIEQVAAELHAKFPEAVKDGPLGVDIVREARDAR